MRLIEKSGCLLQKTVINKKQRRRRFNSYWKSKKLGTKFVCIKSKTLVWLQGKQCGVGFDQISLENCTGIFKGGI